MGGLDLPGRHRLDRTTQDVGRIGGGVKGEGQDRAEPGLADERPERALADEINCERP